MSVLAVAPTVVGNSSKKCLNKDLEYNDKRGTCSNNAWKKLVLNLILPKKPLTKPVKEICSPSTLLMFCRVYFFNSNVVWC